MLLLRKLIVEHASPNQKATTSDFIQLLVQSLPVAQKKFTDDSFNQVVNYDMQVNVLKCAAMADGRFKIDLQVKVGVNKQGINRPLVPDMDVDIAFFDTLKPEWSSNTKPLYLKKHRIKNLTTKLSIVINKKPKIAVVDPYTYLLDANLEDNVQEIK
jgi:ABC-2 type transport system permease protein